MKNVDKGRNIPIASKLCELAMVPRVDTTPYEGLKQSKPQKDAGILTSPIVSVPARKSEFKRS
jgi:hypothetical protein